MLFIDPIGSGHSGAWTGDKPPTPGDMAESIEAVRETENLDSLTLIAHGAVALIALAYANRHSSRLDKLILVSPTVSAPLLAEDLRRIRHSAGRSANAELSRQSTEGIFEDDGDPYREAYLRAARNVLGSNHQPFELMLGFRHDSPPRRFQWRTYRDLWKPRGEFDLTGEWSEIDALPSVESLSVPLLVITGAYDTPAMRQSRSITEANPEAQLLVFPESGHFPFAEEPDRFMARRAHLRLRPRPRHGSLARPLPRKSRACRSGRPCPRRRVRASNLVRPGGAGSLPTLAVHVYTGIDSVNRRRDNAACGCARLGRHAR